MPCARSKTGRTPSATAAVLRPSSSCRVLLLIPGRPPFGECRFSFKPRTHRLRHVGVVFPAERDLESLRIDQKLHLAVVAGDIEPAVLYLFGDVVNPVRVAVAHSPESVWCLAHNATP